MNINELTNTCTSIEDWQEQYKKAENDEQLHVIVYESCKWIVKKEVSVQPFVIAQLSKFSKIAKKTFTDNIKQIEKLNSQQDQEPVQNDASVDRLERFISANYIIRNNIISNRFECKTVDDIEFTEMNEFNILRHLRKNHFKIKIQELIETLKSDFTPQYNPFEEYFESLDVTDTHDYIQDLTNYITLHDETERLFFKQMFEKALVRSIACCLGMGFNKQSFILVGEGQKNQNMGKTSFIRFLCPERLLNYYTEELTLDKDGFIALAENLLINLDELSTLHKAEINQLKTYMSKDIVKVRLPYERRAVTIKRRANFWGSTNESKFLTDLTGNVRWLAFKITHINFDYSKKIDINNVWAQAYRLLTTEKYQYQLTVDEIKLNEKRNDSFMLLPTEMEIIQKYFTPSNKDEENNYFLMTSDFVKILTKLTDHSTKFNVNVVGRALRKLDFEISQKNFKEKEHQLKGYFVTLNDTAISDYLQEYKVHKELDNDLQF